MKIRINLVGPRGTQAIDFEAKENRDVYATVVWKDMAKTKLGAGLELKRWSIKKAGGEKWSGLAAEQGPPVRDGDLLIFHVQPARQQPQPSSG